MTPDIEPVPPCRVLVRNGRQPVVVDSEGVIVIGHLRAMARRKA
jgi:hypothetical protein